MANYSFLKLYHISLAILHWWKTCIVSFAYWYGSPSTKLSNPAFDIKVWKFCRIPATLMNSNMDKEKGKLLLTGGPA
jgi:hypothetical protein